MSLQTTYQSDFKPYNLRYGFLKYPKVYHQPQQQVDDYSWIAQARDDFPWRRRHIATTNVNDAQGRVEWISTPSTQYIDPSLCNQNELKAIQRDYDRELGGAAPRMAPSQTQQASMTPSDDYYYKVRFSPWQFMYPEDSAKMSSQTPQGDFFQRTSPPNAHGVRFECSL